jgi:hypothetical protein
MRWGQVISLHAYLDTEKVVTVFRQMAKEGFAEAVAAPIEDWPRLDQALRSNAKKRDEVMACSVRRQTINY